MRLWQKIFLYTLMLVMLAVSVTSILLLRNSFTLAMEQKKQSAYTEHEFLISNFKSMALSERLRQNVFVLKADAIKEYMQNTFGTENMKGGVAFYDKGRNLVYQNAAMVKEEEELIEIVEEAGTNYSQIRNGQLYIASKETIETNLYYFVTATDIGDVVSMHRHMLQNVQVISMVCAIAIAVVLLVVVKLLLLPLQKINAGTRAIAQGDYQKRIVEAPHLLKAPRSPAASQPVGKGGDEISELAYNMNRMAEAVEKNIKALEDVAKNRKQFIDNLSHEMKTPLTSILGFSDLLRIKKDISEQERVEYASIIMEEAGRMRALSGKLMELITVGKGNLDWKAENVSKLFMEMEASLGVITKSHGLKLDCQCEDGSLVMDRELIKSLVYNLADNGIKASKEGDTIRIHGWFEQDEFIILVEDRGIGIPGEEIGKITQAFYMVDKVRSRARGGAGLGLALCVEIAELHRGSIRIDSKMGQGTTVTARMKGGSLNETD